MCRSLSGDPCFRLWLCPFVTEAWMTVLLVLSTARLLDDDDVQYSKHE